LVITQTQILRNAMITELRILIVFVLFAFQSADLDAQTGKLFDLNPQEKTAIQESLSKISADSIKNYMQSLEDIGTRYTYAENRKKVAEWIAAKFQSFGYGQVYLENFNLYEQDNYNQFTDQYNVVCLRPGDEDFQIVVGAHHDAVKVSPGADDNASGTAGVLELARVMNLAQVQTRFTIKFATFAAEEVGLLGSSYSAHESLFMGDSIALMLNMDMISNSPNDSLPIVDIIRKTSDGYLSDLTNQMGAEFSGMQANTQDYANNSDHHSYGKLSIPVIFFIEHVFSDYYHSQRDSVKHTNPVYASRVLKTVAATLLAFDVLPKVPEVSTVQLGDGRNVKLIWENNPDAVSFQVYLATLNNSFQLYGETTETYFWLTNLNPDSSYIAIVKAVNSANSYSSASIKFKTDSFPNAPQNITVTGLSDHIKIAWTPNAEEDISGYAVYEFKNGQSIKKNDVSVENSYFSDYSITDNLYHYYQVKAVDVHGNESGFSVAKGSKLGKNSYFEDSLELLVVVDAGANPPLLIKTEEFFETILNGRDFEMISLNNVTIIDPDLLFHSKHVIWCTPVANEHVSALPKNIENLQCYLSKGGKLFLSTADPNLSITGYKRTMPTELPTDSLSGDFLVIKTIDFIPDSWLSGVSVAQNSYPPINLNLETIPSGFLTNSYLNFVQSIEPNSFGIPIYTYGSPDPESNLHGQMHGSTVAFEHIDSNFDLIVMSIPLSFFQWEDAKFLTDYILDEKFSNPTKLPELESPGKDNLVLWPIPTQQFVHFEYPGTGKVLVYNSLGVLVFETPFYNESRVHSFDISDLPKGMYLFTIQNESGFVNRKMIKW